MKRILATALLLLIATTGYCGDIDIFHVYTQTDEVTATKLNGNTSNIVTVVNGGLDNDNADTASGFRFYEVLGALPTAGTEGRVVFLTTDDTVNFDTGSAWNKTISSSDTPAQGDVVYRDSSSWKLLTAGTANYPLVTNGTGANPAYEQLSTVGIASSAVTTDKIANDNVTFDKLDDDGNYGPLTGLWEFDNAQIDGGVITGITDLAVADGGTGASTAAQALINLGAMSKTFYSTSGTFIVPTSVTTVYLTMVGGGAGGRGGISGTGGGGGGGGQAIINYPFTVTPSAVLTVTVGAGGTAGPAGSGNGGAGGTTSFDSVSVSGGATVNSASGSAGGGVTIDGSGQTAGGNGVKGGNGGNGAGAAGGGGGGSVFGAGGAGGAQNTAGTAGTGYGSGGGGGGSNNDQAGGAGTAGFVLVVY